jgi:hypothetical protein
VSGCAAALYEALATEARESLPISALVEFDSCTQLAQASSSPPISSRRARRRTRRPLAAVQSLDRFGGTCARALDDALAAFSDVAWRLDSRRRVGFGMSGRA